MEEVIRNIFILAITNGRCPIDHEGRLLKLPSRMDWLGINNPQNLVQSELENSLRLTTTLTRHIKDQIVRVKDSTLESRPIKNEISKHRETKQRDLF